MSRRRFLAGAAAVAGAPLVLPAARLFGGETPSNTLNLAVIGCGGRASGVVLKSRPYPGVRFIAAVDPFRDRREAFATQLNALYETDACRPYADFREVVSREDLDGVAVFTPDHWHVPVAYVAAGYGKHMYVEKPLGVAMTWAWALRRRLREKGVVFQYGTQQRSWRQFRR
ncbi:MAG: gfo/Idh/MocA family oxidoreductase, partial [Verrucomicrobia bacterium]